MRCCIAFTLLLWGQALFAQGPFQFREAALLEKRVALAGREFNANHASYMGREGPSPAEQMIADANNLQVYTTERWVELLNESDGVRHMGALEAAEGQYLDILSKLRRAQGPSANDVCWMLDHLGGFIWKSGISIALIKPSWRRCRSGGPPSPLWGKRRARMPFAKRFRPISPAF